MRFPGASFMCALGAMNETVPVGFQQIIGWAHEQGMAYREALVLYWDDSVQTWAKRPETLV
jgi:DNA gyrase inhibitor